LERVKWLWEEVLSMVHELISVPSFVTIIQVIRVVLVVVVVVVEGVVVVVVVVVMILADMMLSLPCLSHG